MSWEPFCSFDVPGQPVGQPRPRAFSFNGKARIYNPASADGWKESICLSSLFTRPPSPLAVPVSIGVSYQFKRPQYLSKKNAKETVPHVTKPDIDNITKALMDALTCAGYWRDDSLVASVIADKFYAAVGEESRTNVRIYTWKDEEKGA